MIDAAKNQPPQVRKIQMYAWGPVEHKKGNFVVDRAFARDMIASHAFLSARKYFAPILRQHKEEGFTFGRVLSIFTDASGIQAEVALPRKVAQWFDDGFIDSWSPSHRTAYTDPHTGQVLYKVLRELSFVAVRQLKNLPGASEYYSFAEDENDLTELIIMPDEEGNMNEEALAELLAQVAALVEQTAALAARLDALEAPDEEPEEEEPEAPADEPEGGEDAEPIENAEQTARIADLERQLASAKIRAQLPDATDEQVIALSEVPEGMRDVLIVGMRPVAAPVGEQGTMIAGTSPAGELVELCEQLKSAGKTRKTALVEIERAGHDMNDPKVYDALGTVF